MKNLKIGMVALAVSVACFFLGKYSTPTKIEIKEIEKVVYTESTNKKTNTNRDSETVITVKPDGTKITEIKRKSTTTTETDKKIDLEKQSEKTSVVLNHPNLRMNLVYMPKIINKEDVLILDVQKHILSELYIGLSITSQNNFGVSISLGM